jgi:predicted kinase
LRKIADEFDAEFEVVFFDTPLNECIERDLKRENSVGANVILNMWKQYLYKPIEHKEELEDCIICDIDGTLATK